MDTETSRVGKLLADQTEEIVKLKQQNAELLKALTDLHEACRWEGAKNKQLRQQNAELVEELWGIALHSGSREASEMARAAIVKATRGK